ncbi:hypothetical protein BGX26_009228 [Mortierella sp. AD094]|nr:hypothetical protein BGX26_009228 [Mortierella sp. AD094]
MSSNNQFNSHHNAGAAHKTRSTRGSDPGKHEDEDKKYPPPPQGQHSEQRTGGPDQRSEFYVGPAMMPGPFMSSMGANATAFEREPSKTKKE